MAGKDSSTIGSRRPSEREDIAVGIVATETNSDAVAGTILRAQDRGHQVFVTHFNRPDLEAIQFANRLGAGVVSPLDPSPDIETLREAIGKHARANGVGGVIFQEECRNPIDYGESESRLNEGQFIVDAVPATVDETEQETVMVGIPAYNEEGTITDVVEGATAHADDVIVVDDGSSDATAQKARAAGATVIEHETNRGYGGALKTLFRVAANRQVGHLVVLDADGQHEPEDIPHLIDRQRELGCEIVIGSRFVDGSRTNISILRRLGLLVINITTNLSMGIFRSDSRIKDTQSGFRAYNSQAIASLADQIAFGEDMNASIDILYHARANEYDIQEVPTTVYYDVENASTYHPVVHGLTILRNLLRTIEAERPISILGIPGLFITVVGLGFAYWTILNYVNTGTFPYGLAITDTFFAFSGIFLTVTSIILHSLNRHLDR